MIRLVLRAISASRLSRVAGDYRALVEAMPADRLERIEATFLQSGETLGKAKYLTKRNAYLRRSLSRAIGLGLHRGPRRRILDLGSGAGYFLRVCEHFGHHAVGLDLPPTADEPAEDQRTHRLYAELIAAFELERVFHRILPRQPLPATLAGPYDLITANQASFHYFRLETPWGFRGLARLLRGSAATLGRRRQAVDPAQSHSR
ncbi:MAG: methyltransferase domain-containing protein [Acidobacteriota bacterium]